jgi:hypothetical protein
MKCWRGGDHALRWTVTGLLEAQKKFHKVKATEHSALCIAG